MLSRQSSSLRSLGRYRNSARNDALRRAYLRTLTMSGCRCHHAFVTFVSSRISVQNITSKTSRTWEPLQSMLDIINRNSCSETLSQSHNLSVELEHITVIQVTSDTRTNTEVCDATQLFKLVIVKAVSMWLTYCAVARSVAVSSDVRRIRELCSSSSAQRFANDPMPFVIFLTESGHQWIVIFTNHYVATPPTSLTVETSKIRNMMRHLY
ncbi:hypothetical protein K491DRAFT_287120 [Lophiostoma macrostomum CBS 122681]|uniref:Uncharacterized protein n=1 Tax=Lophiostoma macrostomum CBS 122681 TaxID=1314788 RepID=A0A6A6TQG6_9PLEO|nr:hypothetical protein K491DRAFT_287120 [Lophiostoma macrostomum CBS 122681]